MRGASKAARLLAAAVTCGLLAGATPLPDLQKVAEHALPAVVAIGVEQPPCSSARCDLHGAEVPSRPRRGLGTGFVIRSDGYLVTNCHVVAGATRIEVVIGAGGNLRRYPGHVIGCDEPTDLAIVKAEVASPLPTLQLGDSDTLHVAQWVIAIGSPFGLTRTVTAGIVSQLDREDISPQGRQGYFDFIQTDAPINPGSSGGPILDLQGRVVGVADAVHAGGQGIAFAIPVNMLSAVLPQLLTTGRVIRSWLGIHVVRPPADAGGLLGPRRGVLVDDVVAGGPADHAGLRVGDLVVDYEGHAATDPERMRWQMAIAGVGRTLRMSVWRGGRTVLVSATLVRMPEPLPARPPHSIPGLGVAVAPAASPGPFEEAFGGEGARVVRIDRGSPAAAAGLRTGDVVAQINGFAVHSPAGLLLVASTLDDGAAVRLLVRRPDGAAVVAFKKAAATAGVP